MKLQSPIIITGASGFVGANLLHRLVKEVPSKKVHVLLRKNSNTWRIKDVLKKVSIHTVDLQNKSEVDNLLQKIKPQTIFHLATHGAYPYQQVEDEIMNTNIICTFNLMQACTKIGFNAFINTGSSSEYGVNQKLMNENDILNPITAYGVSKAWATLYGKYLAFISKMPITTLRLFGVYGFYEPRGRLMPNIILSLLKNEQPTLISPNFIRDFVFVEDVVNAYLCVARHPSNLIFNIGSGTETTLKEVFYIIKDIMKSDLDPIWDSYTDNQFDANRRIADIKFTKKILRWESKANLHLGLEQTVKWFKNNASLYV